MTSLVTAVQASRYMGILSDPSQTTITVVGVIAILALLMFSAFFASAEIAIFSLEDTRISALVDAGTPNAATLADLKDNPRRLLVTILVGNNIANIGMSSLTTGLLAFYVTPGESVLIATFGVTSLVLLFGETAPKSYGVEHSEGWSLRVARPLRLVQRLLYPIVAVFDALTRQVNRLMGSDADFERAYVTRAAVQEVITAGQRAGVFTEPEHRMLQRLLRFRNRIVKEAMVPRRDIVALERGMELDAAFETFLKHGFTQLPIYEDTLDSVTGVVHVLDLVDARHRDGEQSLQELSTEAYLVPESKEIDDLLIELRQERERLAVVVDEFGATAGMVTIEDIVEEIIGEILGERETAPIRWLDDTTVLLRGELNVHAANEALEIDLPEGGEFETIAGLILDRAGRLVEEGESITHDGITLTVATRARNRILEVRVDLPETIEDAHSS